jgi:hypothetical protein
MIKTWLKNVFWGSTAKSFWTFGSIISAIFGLTPYASQHPLLRLVVPLTLFVIGFFVSSCVEYIALARKLEGITSALTLSQTHTQAGEVMVLGARRHTVVADIYMNARNQSADDNSLRLRSCTVDIPTASPSYLMFIERNVGSNEAFQPSDILGLNPKSEIKPIVKAVFTLPESPFPIPIPNDQVRGLLEILDIHDRKHVIEYSAMLMRNAPITAD